jgi:hypothetical protein
MSEENIIKFLLMQQTINRANSMGWSITCTDNVITLRKKKSKMTSLEKNTKVFVNVLLLPEKFKNILKNIKDTQLLDHFS